MVNKILQYLCRNIQESYQISQFLSLCSNECSTLATLTTHFSILLLPLNAQISNVCMNSGQAIMSTHNMSSCILLSCAHWLALLQQHSIIHANPNSSTLSPSAPPCISGGGP